ncbi:MAG: hypothetical protein AAGK60_00645 [Pseudomonadota bacterium]
MMRIIYALLLPVLFLCCLTNEARGQSRAYELSLGDFGTFTLAGERAENLDSVTVSIKREIFNAPRSRLNGTRAVRFTADQLVRGDRSSTDGASRERLRVEPRRIFSVREAISIDDIRLNAVPGDVISIAIEAKAGSRRTTNRVRFFLPEIVGMAPRACGAENRFAVAVVDDALAIESMETTPEFDGRFAVEFSQPASLCIRRIEGGGPHTMQIKSSRSIDGDERTRCLTSALPTGATVMTTQAQFDICADPSHPDQSELFAIQSFRITATSSGVVIRDRFDRCASLRFPETQVLIFEPCNLFYRGIYWQAAPARGVNEVTLENREINRCVFINPTDYFSPRGEFATGSCASVRDFGLRATVTLRQYRKNDRNDRLSFIDYERVVMPF